MAGEDDTLAIEKRIGGTGEDLGGMLGGRLGEDPRLVFIGERARGGGRATLPRGLVIRRWSWTGGSISGISVSKSISSPSACSIPLDSGPLRRADCRADGP